MKNRQSILLLTLSTICLATLGSPSEAGEGFDYKRAAKKIDEYVLAHLKSNELDPNPTITDDQFVRRTYLAIIGRIPTIEEANTFLTSSDKSKHSALIHQLLANDPAYTAHHFHFWADILRIPTGQHWTLVYREWIRQQIHANTPYDEFARRLVSGHGLVFEDPAAAYYIRDTGMPLDNMSNTVRVFLGTRLECAQCHDHPFDKWTQMDFFKMAAFTYDFDHRGGGVNRSKMHNALKKEERAAYFEAVGMEGFPHFKDDEDIKPWMEKHGERYLERTGMTEAQLREHAKCGMKAQQKLEEYNYPIHHNIGQLGNTITYTKVRHLDRDLQLPHDYQYSDGDPGDIIAPATMFGLEVPEQSDPSERKNAYAQWLTSAENPRFTQVIVNRLWKRTFGYGLFEPVDDLTDDTTIQLPELLAYLEDLMRQVNYDIRKFQSVLFHTSLFRRQVHGEDHPMGTPYDFTGPLMKRMTAEQVWDSIATLVLPNIDTHAPNQEKFLRRISETMAIHKSLEGRPAEEVLERMRIAGDRTREFRQQQQDYEKRITDAYAAGEKDKAKALTLELKKKVGELSKRNRETVFVDLKTDSGQAPAMMTSMMGSHPSDTDSTTETMEMIKNARIRKAPESIVDKKERKRWETMERNNFNHFRETAKQVARAVDLDSPARRGHFLRDFGQSDRDTIQNASSHASVPQSLYLLNSPLAVAIHNPNSVLGSQLEEAPTPEEKIAIVYRAMLTREPTERETARILADYKKYGDETFEDLVWALLNSRQFLFIQ